MSGREVALREPLGVVVIPYQAVSANFHVVRLGEAGDFIALAEVEGVCVPPHRPPFHRVLRLDHVEFARQGGRVGSFGKQRRTDRSPDEHARGMR